STIFNLASTEFTVDPATNTITLNPTTAINSLVTLKIVLAAPSFHRAGDRKVYFGDDPLQVGQPVVDAQGNLTFDASGKVIRHTASSIVNARGNPILHHRGEPLYREVVVPIFGFSFSFFIQDRYAATDPLLTVGNEPRRYLGGQQAFYNSAERVQESATFQRFLVEGTPQEVLYTALETVNVSTGSAPDLVTIENTHTTTTTVNTGNGDDRIAVRTIAGPTTVQSGDGNDTMHVGSQAGLWETDTT